MVEHHDLSSCISALSKPTLLAIIQEIVPNVQHSRMGEQPLETWPVERLQEELVVMLTDRESMERLFLSLSHYERMVLKHFMFYIGDDMVTYRQIEQGNDQIQPNLFRLGLTALRRKGIIYTLRRQWGEVAYFLPSSLECLFYPLVLSYKEQVEPCVEPVIGEKGEYQPFFQDIFILVDELRQLENCQIALTQKGTIPKRFIRSWQERWAEKENGLASFTFSYEHKDIYSNYVMLLLDFCTREQMLRWSYKYVQLNHEAVEQWMNLTRNQMMNKFLSYCQKVLSPSTVWLERYLKDLTRFPSGEWHYLLSPVEIWEDYYTLPPVRDIVELIRNEILSPLLFTGCLEVGQTEAGEQVWRIRSYTEVKQDIWLQPSAELYCPAILEQSLLWRLTEIYFFEKWENMLVLTPSREKTSRFVMRGGSLQSWLQWFETISPIPIPEGLKDRLYSWTARHQQALLKDMTLIELKDHDLAKAFQHWLREHEMEFLRLENHYFLVPLESREQIEDLLAKKGIALLKEQWKEEMSWKETSPLITSIKQSIPYDKVESVFPDLTEAIPAWNRLPELWKKQMNAYHDQTKLSIITQAIDHQLMVRVEDARGQISDWSPITCKIEGGRWVCYDQKQSKYFFNDIRRIQLLFPELKDS